MFVTEYRATAANAPLLFWEVTENPPYDDNGRSITIGSLGRVNGYDRRVLGRVQSLDGLVGMLANEDVGEIRVSEVERAWRAASQGLGPARCRIRPRGTAASDPVMNRSVGYGATSSSVLAHSSAASQTSSFSITMMLLILAVVVLWLALI